MSNSFRIDLIKYCESRFPVWPILLLPLLLTGVVIASSAGMTGVLDCLRLIVSSLLLVLEFRLWDDLADRIQDQQYHPERVLCRTPFIRQFQGLTVALAVISQCSIALLCSWPSFAIISAVHLLLAVWYLVRDRCHFGPTVNYHLVLLKYPAFVLILGTIHRQGFKPQMYFTAAIIYLLLCVFEVLHDGRLRRLKAPWMMLGVEAPLLVWFISIVFW